MNDNDSDDDALTQLAQASQRVPVYRRHVQSPVYVPPSPTTYAPPRKQYSPFAWGFGVALGVIVAVVVIQLFVVGLWMGATTGSHVPRETAPLYTPTPNIHVEEEHILPSDSHIVEASPAAGNIHNNPRALDVGAMRIIDGIIEPLGKSSCQSRGTLASSSAKTYRNVEVHVQMIGDSGLPLESGTARLPLVSSTPTELSIRYRCSQGEVSRYTFDFEGTQAAK